MSIHHLLQDLVRAAIYRRGLADGSQSLTKKLQKRAASKTVQSRRPNIVMPGKAAESPSELVKPKTEAQQAQNRRKLQTFKEKRKAREPLVSQQYP